MTDAEARIRAVVAAIPAGCVATYGEVAARAGLPGRARLVGHVLATLPAGTCLPWHRVVAAGGRLALPPGSLAGREQRRRLRAEGVGVRGGRVAAMAGRRDLDALLWEPLLAGRGVQSRAT